MCVRLRVLRLARNRLQALPEAIGAMTGLQYLDITGNRLQAVPRAVAKCTALQALELGQNRLRGLTSGLGSLTRLVRLDLSHNQYRHLPSSLGQLTQLQQLLLEDNALEDLPDSTSSLGKLTELTLATNRLWLLPGSVCHMPQLQYLSVGGNPLVGQEACVLQLQQQLPHLALDVAPPLQPLPQHQQYWHPPAGAGAGAGRGGMMALSGPAAAASSSSSQGFRAGPLGTVAAAVAAGGGGGAGPSSAAAGLAAAGGGGGAGAVGPFGYAAANAVRGVGGAQHEPTGPVAVELLLLRGYAITRHRIPAAAELAGFGGREQGGTVAAAIAGGGAASTSAGAAAGSGAAAGGGAMFAGGGGLAGVQQQHVMVGRERVPIAVFSESAERRARRLKGQELVARLLGLSTRVGLPGVNWAKLGVPKGLSGVGLGHRQQAGRKEERGGAEMSGAEGSSAAPGTGLAGSASGSGAAGAAVGSSDGSGQAAAVAGERTSEIAPAAAAARAAESTNDTKASATGGGNEGSSSTSGGMVSREGGGGSRTGRNRNDGGASSSGRAEAGTSGRPATGSVEGRGDVGGNSSSTSAMGARGGAGADAILSGSHRTFEEFYAHLARLRPTIQHTSEPSMSPNMPPPLLERIARNAVVTRGFRAGVQHSPRASGVKAVGAREGNVETAALPVAVAAASADNVGTPTAGSTSGGNVVRVRCRAQPLQAQAAVSAVRHVVPLGGAVVAGGSGSSSTDRPAGAAASEGLMVQKGALRGVGSWEEMDWAFQLLQPGGSDLDTDDAALSSAVGAAGTAPTERRNRGALRSQPCTWEVVEGGGDTDDAEDDFGGEGGREAAAAGGASSSSCGVTGCIGGEGPGTDQMQGTAAVVDGSNEEQEQEDPCQQSSGCAGSGSVSESEGEDDRQEDGGAADSLDGSIMSIAELGLESGTGAARSTAAGSAATGGACYDGVTLGAEPMGGCLEKPAGSGSAGAVAPSSSVVGLCGDQIGQGVREEGSGGGELQGQGGVRHDGVAPGDLETTWWGN